MSAPTGPCAFGFREADLDRAAALTVEHTRYNPRPLDLPSIRGMLQSAWEGRRP